MLHKYATYCWIKELQMLKFFLNIFQLGPKTVLIFPCVHRNRFLLMFRYSHSNVLPIKEIGRKENERLSLFKHVLNSLSKANVKLQQSDLVKSNVHPPKLVV